MKPTRPQAEEDPIRRAVAAVHEALLGQHVGGLDPVGRVYDALEETCFRDPAAWTRLADALDAIMNDAPDNTRTTRSTEALRSLASGLEHHRAQATPPSPAAWADIVEFAATEVACRDLERDEGRHTRLTESFRNRLRQRRRQRPPMEWSWEALSRPTE